MLVGKLRNLLAATTTLTCRGIKQKWQPMDALTSVKDSNAVDRAVSLLQAGHVVAVPTDTVYGLACSATDSSAVEKLYEIKARDENKPIAICLGNVADIENWAQVDHLPKELLLALLPGAVTLILNTASVLDRSLCINNKVGIRVPDYPFLQTVIERLNCPIALTSANISNEPSSIAVSEFVPLWPRLAAVFDGGVLASRSASTIVDLSHPGFYFILRKGSACDVTRKTLNHHGLHAF